MHLSLPMFSTFYSDPGPSMDRVVLLSTPLTRTITPLRSLFQSVGVSAAANSQTNNQARTPQSSENFPVSDMEHRDIKSDLKVVALDPSKERIST